jgi:hypothetical protein
MSTNKTTGTRRNEIRTKGLYSCIPNYSKFIHSFIVNKVLWFRFNSSIEVMDLMLAKCAGLAGFTPRSIRRCCVISLTIINKLLT